MMIKNYLPKILLLTLLCLICSVRSWAQDNLEADKIKVDSAEHLWKQADKLWTANRDESIVLYLRSAKIYPLPNFMYRLTLDKIMSWTVHDATALWTTYINELQKKKTVL